MRTKSKRSSYPEAWWDKGGFPKRYPYEEPFHHHLNYMVELLNTIKGDSYSNELTSPEKEFLTSLKKYYKDGFEYFADDCLKHYNIIAWDKLET